MEFSLGFLGETFEPSKNQRYPPIAVEFDVLRPQVPQNATLEDLAKAFLPLGGTFQSFAAAGTNQATATLVTAREAVVTGADGTVGVLLHPISTNPNPKVIYNSGTSTLKIYGSATGSNTINGTGGATGVSLAAKCVAIFSAVSSTGWSMLSGPATATFASPTLTGATLTGITIVGDSRNPTYNRATVEFTAQPTVTTLNATGTLTAAMIASRILTATSSSAIAATLDTGTAMDTAQAGATANDSLDYTVINLGSSSGAFTVTASSGHTIVGNAVVAINTSATFRAKRVSANTWVSYRLNG